MVFKELAGNGAPPRNPEENLQHALLLPARTEVHVVPTVLEASALPHQRVTLILKAVCGAGTHVVFCAYAHLA